MPPAAAQHSIGWIPQVVVGHATSSQYTTHQHGPHSLFANGSASQRHRLLRPPFEPCMPAAFDISMLGSLYTSRKHVTSHITSHCLVRLQGSEQVAAPTISTTHQQRARRPANQTNRSARRQGSKQAVKMSISATHRQSPAM